MTVDKTLEERGARYGAFIDHATIAQGLQEVLAEAPNWYRLQPDVRQMMVVITDKLARILNGDPDYTDNYHDIQGYAKLVETRLLKEEQSKKGQLFESANQGPILSPDQEREAEEYGSQFRTRSQVLLDDEKIDVIRQRNRSQTGPIQIEEAERPE